VIELWTLDQVAAHLHVPDRVPPMSRYATVKSDARV
jgi:hypothetical protein